MTAERKCPAITLSMETLHALQRAEAAKDPQAHLEAVKGVFQCERGPHEGYDHQSGDVHWNDEPAPEDEE